MRYAAAGDVLLLSDPATAKQVAVGLAEELNFVTACLADLKHQHGAAPGIAMCPTCWPSWRSGSWASPDRP